MATWSLGELGDPRVLDQLLVEQPSQGPGSLQPASTLADIGNVAVPQLIAALEDQARPAYQRVNAASALGRINDERVVEPLIAALRDDDEDVRVAAIDALGYLEYAKAVKPLLAVMAVEPLLAASHDDPVPEVRRKAIGELATIDDQRAFDAVAHYVRESGEGEEGDKSASDVLWTLALHHGERALPLLREMALGTEHWRWLRAIHGLSRLGAPGVSVLLEIGREHPPQRRHLVITWLKFAYHHSPDPRIVDFLFEVIQETPTSNVAEMMRYHAVLELGECGDPRAVGPLLEMLENAPGMRYPVVQLLGKLGDERALKALIAMYEESKAQEEKPEIGEEPGRRHNSQEFQDALVRAIAKIRLRLGTMEADADPSSSSAAT
jgi:HEAT repeat protein